MPEILYSTETLGPGVILVTWSNMAEGDIGQPFDAALLPDKSVHVYGQFGTGGTILIEGANKLVKPLITDTLPALRDSANAILSFTSDDLKQITPIVRWVRPRVSAGTGVVVSVSILASNINGTLVMGEII